VYGTKKKEKNSVEEEKKINSHGYKTRKTTDKYEKEMMVGGNIINETIYCNMKNTTHENRGCHHYLGGRLRTKEKKQRT